MQFYPAGETIARRLLDMPTDRTEWIITGAEAGEVIAAGFEQQASDKTRFVHAESGDIYQLARRQYLDDRSGQLRFRCDAGVTLENELATRPLTILAMAADGDDIIDPFDGQEDLIGGALRHVTPFFQYQPQNLLVTALWAARLRPWGFRIAHGTFGLMGEMVAAGAALEIQRRDLCDAVLDALASSRPSVFFTVLHRCKALPLVSAELAALFRESKENHSDNGVPEVLLALDRAASETENVTTVIKNFYDGLAGNAEAVFAALGLSALHRGAVGKIDNAD